MYAWWLKDEDNELSAGTCLIFTTKPEEAKVKGNQQPAPLEAWENRLLSALWESTLLNRFSS